MKYILKLSKKFLLLALMIVLPINNFAAVSVSDGSAFVSKSEFSASLNNMSNRISIIENTLDAKIDSLVSSYLSRNGIWNGDKQTVVSTGTTYQQSIKTANSRTRAYVMGLATADKSFNVVDSDRPEITFTGSANPTKATFVNNISKSGLCVLQYTLNTTSSGHIRVTLRNTDGGVAAYLMNAWLIYTRGIEIYETIGSTTSLSVAELQTIPVAVPGSFAVLTERNKYLYFFVTKGSKLSYANILYCNTKNAVCTWDQNTLNAVILSSYPSITSCVIY